MKKVLLTTTGLLLIAIIFVPTWKTLSKPTNNYYDEQYYSDSVIVQNGIETNILDFIGTLDTIESVGSVIYNTSVTIVESGVGFIDYTVDAFKDVGKHISDAIDSLKDFIKGE